MIDFVYIFTVLSMWCAEYLFAKHILEYMDEKKQEYMDKQKDAAGAKKAKILFQVIEGISVPIAFGFIALPIFLIGMIQNNAQEQLRQQQWSNCENATNSKGEYLTWEQCNYFRNVMNGEYTDTTYYVRELDD